MSILLDTTTPHQVTVSMADMPTTTREYTSPRFTGTGSWANADGWSASAGMTVSVLQDGLRLVASGAVGTTWIQRTVAPPSGWVPGELRRVRARVRLTDPEGRPVVVRLGDNVSGPSSQARLVPGVPVWLEGTLNSQSETQVRLYVEKPAGATDGRVVLEGVAFDRVSPGWLSWFLLREDLNTPTPGEVIARASYGYETSATGTLAVVDREPSLVGNVTYTLNRGITDGLPSSQSATAPVVSDGHAVLTRLDTGTMHACRLYDWSGTRAGRAEVLDVAGAEFPNVPTQPLAARRGQAVLEFATLDAAAAVARDLGTGRVHLLRQNQADRTDMDAYLVATNLTVERFAPTAELPAPRWQVAFDYQETARGAYL